MADINKLKAVIDADAYGLNWAGKDDTTVAAEIMNETTADTAPVDAGQVRIWAAGEVLYKVVQAASTGATDGLKGLADAASRFYDSDEAYIRATHQPMLDRLVAGGVLTQGEADALDEQADITVTISQKEALGRIAAVHVARARSL